MNIFPSLISADLLNLEKTIKLLEPHCDGFHVDVMDDHFVPNLTWGPAFVDSIIKVSELPINLHLMVDNPEKWIHRVKLRNIDTFVFHYEAIKDGNNIFNLIDAIKTIGCKVGMAINPETSASKIFDYVDNIDHVLVMSVNPGFSGQKFMPEVLNKVETLVNQRDSMNLNFTLSMDGGINKENIELIREAGIDEIGMANAIFSQKDIVKALKDLY